MYRTSTIGTGGSAITGVAADTSDPALPAGITARDAPTGGATTSGGVLAAEVLGTDETSDGEYAGENRAGNTQYLFRSGTGRRPFVIRENQGFKVVTGPLSGVGNVVVIVEGTVE